MAEQASVRVFEDGFQRIVVAPSRADALIRAGIPSLCNHARGPFDSRASALCYCLCYQHMHFQSLRQILSYGSLDAVSRPLVIDIGSGPATAAVALGERYRNLQNTPMPMSYFAIDSSEPMHQIAAAYLEDAQLFNVLECVMLGSIVEAIERIGEFQNTEGCTEIVLSLSYILKQPGADTALGNRIADFAARAIEITGLPAYVLVQDTSASPYDARDAFRTRLLEHRYLLPADGRVTQQHRRVDVTGAFVPQGEPRPGNVWYVAGSLSAF